MAKPAKPKLPVIVDRTDRERIINTAATAKGGWTKAQLALWGISWPPPKGWKERLLNGLGPLPIYEKPDVTISHHPSESLPPKLPRTAAATQARRLQTGYGPHVDKIVERMSWLGATDEDMWKALGVVERTFYRWAKAYPTMRQAKDRGRQEATAQVTKALYRRAIGYKHKAVKVFLRKDDIEPVYAPFIERYPPDTAAALAWLTNRDPARWKNKQEVIVDLNVLARRALLEMADD